MKKAFTIILISVLSLTAHAQNTFLKTYGGSKKTEGIAMLELENGNFLLAGNINDNNAYRNDIYLVETDSDGDTLWTRRIDLDTAYGYANHAVHSLQATFDGNFALSVLYDGMEPLLIKLNGTGEVLWYNNIQPIRPYKAISFQYGFGLDFRECPDRGFVFAWGREIIKTDSLGEFEWKHHVNEVLYNTCYLNAIEISDQGVIAAAGYATQQNAGTHDDIYCIALGMDGNLLWDVAYEDPGYDQAYSICENSDGFVLVAKDPVPNSGNPDILLMKISYTGDVLWIKSMNVEVGAYPYDICSTDDGNMMITGEEYLNNRTYAFLYKIDASGEVIWNAYFQADPSDEFHWGMEVIEAQDGGYAIFGTTSDSPNFSNMMLIKTDENGIVTTVEDLKISNENEAICSPNPFSNFTRLNYTLQTASHISLRIFNKQGAMIYCTPPQWQLPGNHVMIWDGSSSNGQFTPSGVYIYQIMDEHKVLYSGKIILQ